MKIGKCFVALSALFAGCSSTERVKDFCMDLLVTQHSMCVGVSYIECKDFKLDHITSRELTEANRANGISEDLIIEFNYLYRHTPQSPNADRRSPAYMGTEWNSMSVTYYLKKRNDVWEIMTGMGKRYTYPPN